MAVEHLPEPQPELDEPEAKPGYGEMTLMEHLRELRNRVLICAVAVVAGIVLCLVFWQTILGWLLAPAPQVMGADGQLEDFRVASFSPTDRIAVIFKIGLYGGLIVASPVIIYQIMMFILPGLTARERRILLPGLAGTIGFLAGGMAFAYYIILPASLGFLLELGDRQFVTLTGAKQYIDFVTRIVFWVGISFELPMVLALAARLGMVRAKQLLKFWRYAIVLVFVIAAIVTPTPDPLTQSLVAGPLLLLYFVGILMAFIVQPRKKPEPPVAEPVAG
ncbi:MAG TPA: twin-arginine translocase subunit TatC [Tepidiformaceae bacterium]|nr:twin-arginine translocase subunit TatC [Tepidiformaceae bacterium]